MRVCLTCKNISQTDLHILLLNPQVISLKCLTSLLTSIIIDDQFGFVLGGTVVSRGGVEDTRLEAKDTKKSEAKDSLYEDRTSRGQGQECSRPMPRTEDTGASVLLKKKVFKNIFQAISNSLAYPKFLIRKA